MLTYALPDLWILTAGTGRLQQHSPHDGRGDGSGNGRHPGTQFSCFTGARVQMLTQLAARAVAAHQRLGLVLYWYLLGFTGTKIQILTQQAARAVPAHQLLCRSDSAGFTGTKILALLVQKY